MGRSFEIGDVTFDGLRGRLRFFVPTPDVSRAPTEPALGRQAVREISFGVESGQERSRALVQALAELLALPEAESRALDQGRGRLEHLLAPLELALATGRLQVVEERLPSLTDRRAPLSVDLPPLPPPRREGTTTFFELRFVDEIGQGIGGITTEFALAGELRSVTTNAGGVAFLDGVVAGSATASVVDTAELERVLEPRWQKFRPGSPSAESNSSDLLFEGAPVTGIGVRPVIPQRVVIKPPLGRIFLELFDKTGQVRHLDSPYRIEGPQSFEGRSDDEGLIVHEDVFPGDYRLSLDLTLDIDGKQEVVTLETQVVVLAPASATPEVRMLGVVPRVELARLKGLLFDTNKSFLLPASTAVFERFEAVFREHRFDELLIVGHTDTTADAKINDPLSLERAENTAAYLRNDVDTWLKMYDDSVRAAGRWGEDEDAAMLLSLPDFDSKPPEESDVRWFQRTRGLKVDGIAGPETRRQLIREYMDLDGISLDTDEFGIEITTHGCGENFPLAASGEGVDPSPRDDLEDAADRRVELFFFDPEFGILPPPPGKNSKPGSAEYSAWRRRAKTISDDTLGQFSLAVRLFDDRGDPLPEADFRIEAGAVVIDGKSDEDGFARAVVTTDLEHATLSWLKPSASDPTENEFGFDVDTDVEFVFSRPVFLELLSNAESQEDRAESTRRALHNLGYEDDDLATSVRHFQFDNELPLTGAFDDVRTEALRRNDEGDPNRPS